MEPVWLSLLHFLKLFTQQDVILGLKEEHKDKYHIKYLYLLFRSTKNKKYHRAYKLTQYEKKHKTCEM